MEADDDHVSGAVFCNNGTLFSAANASTLFLNPKSCVVTQHKGPLLDTIHQWRLFWMSHVYD